MRRMKFTLFVLLFTGLNVFGQFTFDETDAGVVDGGLGMSWIDGEPYYTFQFRPEISVGKFGMGLDLNLEFNSDGLRTENFNSFSDYLSVIRYVRYGRRYDPYYIRVGALDYASLGYGNVMYMYNNSPSFDARTIGMNFKLDFDVMGVEGVYSDFSQAGVLAVRGFIRPLKFTSLGSVPIIGGLTFGITYANDMQKYAGVLKGYYDSADDKIIVDEDYGNVQIGSIDVGLPIFKNNVVNWELYYTYTKILDAGDGQSYGTLLGLDFRIVDVKIKFERNINNPQYMPSYFNATHEIDRYKVVGDSVVTKYALLQNLDESGANGYYGGLMIDVLGAFKILGSYQRMDKVDHSGMLNLYSQITPETAPVVVKAGYSKTHIDKESELFKLDDRSLFFVEAGYKPYPFLIVSLVYKWTFTPIRGINDEIIDFEPQKKIEPRISFVYPFNM
jgi:hypothetical protein